MLIESSIIPLQGLGLESEVYKLECFKRRTFRFISNTVLDFHRVEINHELLTFTYFWLKLVSSIFQLNFLSG